MSGDGLLDDVATPSKSPNRALRDDFTVNLDVSVTEQVTINPTPASR